MSIDVSLFKDIGAFLFNTAINIYKSLDFDFGEFTVNGWVLLVGLAVVSIVIWFFSRILE